MFLKKGLNSCCKQRYHTRGNAEANDLRLNASSRAACGASLRALLEESQFKLFH